MQCCSPDIVNEFVFLNCVLKYVLYYYIENLDIIFVHLLTQQEKEKSSTGAVANTLTTAQSEMSSLAHFNNDMAPEQLLMGFRQHHQQKHQRQLGHQPPAHHGHPPMSQLARSRAQGVSASQRSIRGLVTQYVPKNGVQYYRDLAGNIKQVSSGGLMLHIVYRIFLETLVNLLSFCVSY